MNAPNAIPLLKNGDRLSRLEFERRYSAASYIHKAELIEGTMKSHSFPALWLNVSALLERNGIEVLATVQTGVQSPEHQTFVEALRSR